MMMMTEEPNRMCDISGSEAGDSGICEDGVMMSMCDSDCSGNAARSAALGTGG